jgi:hypothetical protein
MAGLVYLLQLPAHLFLGLVVVAVAHRLAALVALLLMVAALALPAPELLELPIQAVAGVVDIPLVAVQVVQA